MSLQVLDLSGNKVGEQEVPSFLQLEKINEPLIWEIVKAEHNNRRQGTHVTKTRGLVRGGGKKPWRQKGTGRARHGSIRSPIWRGGGITFGPQMRSHRENVPQKKKKNGLKQIFAKKINDQLVVLLQEFRMEKISSQEAFQSFTTLVQGTPFAERYNHNRKFRNKTNDKRRSIVVVVAEDNQNNKLSLRNIPWIQMIHVDRLSALALFYNHGLIITQDAFKELEKKLT